MEEGGWREVAGWRAAGWRDGWSEMRLGSRGSMSRVSSCGSRFCGSQGWTVPGGSVPVCGSVYGLPESMFQLLRQYCSSTASPLHPFE